MIKLFRGEKMNKLFIFDLDGTLLNSDNVITEESKKAIWKCKNKGGYIEYITGRGTINSRRFFYQEGLQEMQTGKRSPSEHLRQLPRHD